MGLARNEAELASKASAFLKAEIAKAEVTYEGLAKAMKRHGLIETKASVTNKLARGTFPATFFLGALAALELEGVRLEDL
jgi:hypothetical protein